MSIHNLDRKISASQARSDEFDVLLRQNLAGYVDAELAARIVGVAEVQNPPSNNMGGIQPSPPLFLPHREKSTDFGIQKTSIDWLSASSTAGVDAMRLLLGVVWPSVVFSTNSKGMPGYPKSDTILVDGVCYGLLGYGASHGRDFFSITGTGCRTLNDELIEVFYEALQFIDARISRIDLCFDIYNGELTFDHAKWARDKGAFKRAEGKQPKFKDIGEIDGDGKNLGRTFYVGNRAGECFGRIYEKGLEVFAKLPEEFRLMSDAREIINGSKPQFADDWLRLEVEYKFKDKDRPLPLEMMLDRDRYFAGAYPYFADALGRGDGRRPASVVNQDNVDWVRTTNAARRSTGPLVHLMKECGFTNTEIVEMLDAGKVSNRLVKSGLFAKMKSAAESFKLANPDWDVPF